MLPGVHTVCVELLEHVRKAYGNVHTSVPTRRPPQPAPAEAREGVQKRAAGPAVGPSILAGRSNHTRN